MFTGSLFQNSNKNPHSKHYSALFETLVTLIFLSIVFLLKKPNYLYFPTLLHEYKNCLLFHSIFEALNLLADFPVPQLFCFFHAHLYLDICCSLKNIKDTKSLHSLLKVLDAPVLLATVFCLTIFPDNGGGQVLRSCNYTVRMIIITVDYSCAAELVLLQVLKA